MTNKNQHSIWRRKAFIRLLMAGSFILIILTSFGLGKEIIRRQQINQEIEDTKRGIESLEKKNKELAQMIEYLETDSFKEIQARQNLGYQREGEVAVSVESSKGSYNQDRGTTFTQPPPTTNSNPARWWKYFFAAR